MNEKETKNPLEAIKRLKALQINMNKELKSENLSDNHTEDADTLSEKNDIQESEKSDTDTASKAKKVRSKKTPSLMEIAYEAEQEKGLKDSGDSELEKILEKTPQDELIDNFFDSINPAKKKTTKKNTSSASSSKTAAKKASVISMAEKEEHEDILLKTLRSIDGPSAPASKSTLSSILSGETVIEPKKTRGRKPKAPKKVKIITLGGLEQIGMNITAF